MKLLIEMVAAGGRAIVGDQEWNRFVADLSSETS